MKGEINRKCQKNLQQRKKHVEQMCFEEKMFLLERLDNMKKQNILLSNHIRNKKAVTFNKLQVEEALRMVCTKDIVEYNEVDAPNYHDERLLIRSRPTYDIEVFDNKTKKMIRCACQLCLVVSLLSGSLVTAYYNKVDDNHLTLNPKRYDVDLQIIKKH